MIELQVQDIDSVSSVVEQVHAPMYSVQYIPSIYNFVSQGVFHSKTPGLTVRSTHGNAIITPYSDIVQIGGDCIYGKILRQTAEKNIFTDKNLIHANAESLQIQIKDPVIAGKLTKGYSMLGAASSHWGHFICEYYPSFLATLPTLADDVVIIIPANYDAIQIALIKFALDFHAKNNPVYYCPTDQSVLVEQLYISEKASFLSDHADWISIYDTIIQDFCHTELSKFTRSNATTAGDPGHEKIFLTRRGLYRNVSNIDEVEIYFKANGYTVLDPGELSHADRIKLFSGCKELSGIYSSAFFNLIYCPHVERVKIIAPFVRCIDQIYLNIFRPDQFSFYIADSCDKGIHPNVKISAETCENLVGS